MANEKNKRIENHNKHNKPGLEKRLERHILKLKFKISNLKREVQKWDEHYEEPRQ